MSCGAGHVGFLVPQPGIEPGPLQRPKHRTPGNSHLRYFFDFFPQSFLWVFHGERRLCAVLATGLALLPPRAVRTAGWSVHMQGPASGWRLEWAGRSWQDGARWPREPHGQEENRVTVGPCIAVPGAREHGFLLCIHLAPCST